MQPACVWKVNFLVELHLLREIWASKQSAWFAIFVPSVTCIYVLWVVTEKMTLWMQVSAVAQEDLSITVYLTEYSCSKRGSSLLSCFGYLVKISTWHCWGLYLPSGLRVVWQSVNLVGRQIVRAWITLGQEMSSLRSLCWQEVVYLHNLQWESGGFPQTSSLCKNKIHPPKSFKMSVCKSRRESLHWEAFIVTCLQEVVHCIETMQKLRLEN